MTSNNIILDILKKEVVPAMGCTEPVAVALACAKARELIDNDKITGAIILVSPNIYKNGLGVGIPNTDEVGLEVAAALGIVGGNSEKKLKVLEGIELDDVIKAKTIVEKKSIGIGIKDTDSKVYVEVRLEGLKGYSRVIIRDRHDNFVLFEKNGAILYESLLSKTKDNSENNILFNMKITDILDTIESMDSCEFEFLLEGLDMNRKIAKKALERSYGLGVGYSMHKVMLEGLLSSDLLNTATMLTAAGADARMAGLNMPVMSSNGSGNNGLTAILPIAAYDDIFKVPKEELVKALAISHTLNCYIKHYIGRLSALCGCAVSSATGSGAAIAWLMGASHIQIEGVIKNMIANLSGMICDGAKASCALKVATASSVAIQSAVLALNNSIVLSRNGIIASTVEDTIKNLGILSNEGMNLTDKVILDIMRKMA